MCAHKLLCNTVLYRCARPVSVSTLHPVLTEYITKNMSASEEKQESMKRSAEGQSAKKKNYIY